MTAEPRQNTGVVYTVRDDHDGQVVFPQTLLHSRHQASVKNTFIPQIILSCFVFWLFGFLFGLIAFVLARKCRNRLILLRYLIFLEEKQNPNSHSQLPPDNIIDVSVIGM